MASREAKVVISLPTLELMGSLASELYSFPGGKGMWPQPPDRFEVELFDFPKEASELEEVLGAVQAWLNESGLESVTVEAGGVPYELRRSND